MRAVDRIVFTPIRRMFSVHRMLGSMFVSPSEITASSTASETTLLSRWKLRASPISARCTSSRMSSIRCSFTSIASTSQPIFTSIRAR